MSRSSIASLPSMWRAAILRTHGSRYNAHRAQYGDSVPSLSLCLDMIADGLVFINRLP